MATDMALKWAIDVVARQCLTNGDERCWENYPEIGEDDWDLILARMGELTPAPDTSEFKEAYAFLEDRADDAEGGYIEGSGEADRGAIDAAIDLLNRVHAADPTVLPALIAYRVPCNLAVADDPTVQVGKINGAENDWEVGLLGIINGLFGVQGERAVGFIAAHRDDDGQLTHFVFNEQP